MSFSLAALLLAGIGLYGVLATIVGRRRREIGLRMALGASPGAILRAVIGEGLVITAAGTVVGLAAAMFLSRALESLVYGAGALDGDILAAALALTTGAALLACAVPARKASRTEAVEALRLE